jgi:hypothetical protein
MVLQLIVLKASIKGAVFRPHGSERLIYFSGPERCRRPFGGRVSNFGLSAAVAFG